MNDDHEVGYLDQPLRILDGQQDVRVDGVAEGSKTSNAHAKIGCNDQSVCHVDPLHHLPVW